MGRDDIKTLIIDKARELIKDNGGFTIKELTDATHVNIAAVNYHFGSKENLTRMIIQDVIIELKRVLTYFMYRLDRGVKIDVFIHELVNLLYKFTFENAGLIKYLFVSIDSQQITTSELIDAFFSENEFTTLVYTHLGKLIGSDNPKEIAARYLAFFAAGAAPMFIQLMQGKNRNIDIYNDEEFKNIYINQMIRMLA